MLIIPRGFIFAVAKYIFMSSLSISSEKRNICKISGDLLTESV